MRKIFWILIILLLGVNLLQNSAIFCTKNVDLQLSQIIEHNELLDIKNINVKNFTQAIKNANDKYITDFSAETIEEFSQPSMIPDLNISTDILHFYLVFLLIKSLIITALGILLIKKVQSYTTDNSTNLYEYILISFLAIYQPLEIYSINLREIKFFQGISIIFAIYIYFLLAYIIFRLLIKNRIYCIITAIFWTILSLNFFSFLFFVGNYVNLFCIIFIILYFIYSINPETIKKIAKLISLTLIIFVTINFITSMTSILSEYMQKKTQEKYTNLIEKSSNKNRDIYIIILDAYSGTDILKQKFDFDNHYFINSLKQEGFYIFDHMYSNYNSTYASIPTMLNLEFLENTGYNTSSQAINNALLFKIAKQNNYHTVFKKDQFFNIKSKYIDISEEIKYQGLFDIYNILFTNSLYKNQIITILRKSVSRKDVFYSGKLEEKNFILIHVMSPHYPYLYDKDGNDIKRTNIYNMEKSYIPYLEYTNKITLEYIKYIKQTHKKLPVIIVTGDHGLRDDSILESAFSTFTAYYNPEQEYQHIKNSKSLINFFINFANYEFNINLSNTADRNLYLIKSSENQELTILKGIKDAKNVTSQLKFNGKSKNMKY